MTDPGSVVDDPIGGDWVDPRILATRRAVYAATIELIAEVGVQAATVERIAERSGVARSTVYRRWPVLARLYYDAFAQLARRRPVHAAVGTPAELLAYLDDYADRLNDPTYCAVLVSLLDAAWRDPELARLRRSVFDEGSSRVAAILAAGVEAGRVRPDLVMPDAIDALVAPFLYRRLVEQQPITPDDVRRRHADVLARFGLPADERDRRPGRPGSRQVPSERARDPPSW